MRRRGRFAAVGLAFGAGVTAMYAGPSQTKFAASSEAVAVHAVVADRRGALVPNLPREAFSVLVDGRQTPIVVFSNEPQPIAAVLLIHTETSDLPPQIAAAHALIDGLRSGDRLRIGTFGQAIAMSPYLVADQARLHRIVDEEVWPEPGNQLGSALDAAMTSLHAERGRKAVLVIDDNGSRPRCWPGPVCIGPDQARRRAVEDGFIVYGIELTGTKGNPNQIADGTVRRVALETGGGFRRVRADHTIRAAMQQVVDELRGQYLLGIVPPRVDDRVHALRVSVSGLVVRARRSFRLQAAR